MKWMIVLSVISAVSFAIVFAEDPYAEVRNKVGEFHEKKLEAMKLFDKLDDAQELLEEAGFSKGTAAFIIRNWEFIQRLQSDVGDDGGISLSNLMRHSQKQLNLPSYLKEEHENGRLSKDKMDQIIEKYYLISTIKKTGYARGLNNYQLTALVRKLLDQGTMPKLRLLVKDPTFGSDAFWSVENNSFKPWHIESLKLPAAARRLFPE